MTTSPVMRKPKMRLTEKGRRVAPTFVAATAIMVIELYYVNTGLMVFDDLMLALSAIVTVELFLAAFLIKRQLHFVLTAATILGVFTVGCMGVYGAFS